MSEQNKLVKMVTDSAVLVGISAGVGLFGEENSQRKFSRRPVLKRHELREIHWCSAGSMALKTYLEDQKILPKSI